MNHEFYMKRCLQLAQMGLSEAAPNPSVGAVLVHDMHIIGEGYTSPYGGSHGEVNCIQQAKQTFNPLPSNSILYVSLEPCAHQGKTPACSNLIIEEGIQTVVIACEDPNYLVKGKGIQQLKEAGIELVLGVCNKDALHLNKRFFTFHQKRRPYISLKWAQSPEGNFAPINNKQFWISNSKTKALVHKWRSEEMAILVGDRTIMIDNPKLNTRLVEGISPLRIVINTEMKIDTSNHVLSDELPTLFFNFDKAEKVGNKEFILLHKQEEIIPQILKELYQRNVNSLLVEGGVYTLQQFINSGLWDEARIITGQNKLEKGIPAPLIEGQTIQEFDLIGDHVKIINKEE